MKSIHFFLTGIVLILGQFIVRVISEKPAGVYTNLNVILDITLLLGLSIVFVGMVYWIVTKLYKK